MNLHSLRFQLGAVSLAFFALVASSVVATTVAKRDQSADALLINLAGRQRMFDPSHPPGGTSPPCRRREGSAAAFEQQHGSTACAGILVAKLGRRFNLADPGEAVECVSAGGPQTGGEVLGSTVRIAGELIMKRRSRPPRSGF
jgi:hypothetical protein